MRPIIIHVDSYEMAQVWLDDILNRMGPFKILMTCDDAEQMRDMAIYMYEFGILKVGNGVSIRDLKVRILVSRQANVVQFQTNATVVSDKSAFDYRIFVTKRCESSSQSSD